jgi:hypothetical protein
MVHELVQTDPLSTPKTMDKVKARFVVEFQRPNLEQQSCIELKEIKQWISVSAWEYDQHFWDLINRISY